MLDNCNLGINIKNLVRHYQIYLLGWMVSRFSK